MHNLTKTLLTSLALTLGACDAGDISDDFGEGATEFRPGGLGGFSLNTSFLGGHDHSELDLEGGVHKGAKLTKVCLSGKRDVCIYPGKDDLFVKKSEIMATKGVTTYMGTDFIGARWFLEIDYDRDGSLDSTIETVLLDVKANATAAGLDYWDYFWAYDTKTVTGLATKYIKVGEEPVPMCEVDPDTGSLGSVVLGDTSIDTTPTTKAVVEKLANSMFIACHSGAAGKAPTWGYLLHDVGHNRYTNVLRVMRADYCNTGESWTEPGEKVAITDLAGISDQYDANNKLEGLASFADGWLCINKPRVADLNDVTSTCDIKLCDPNATLGDMGSDILTQIP